MKQLFKLFDPAFPAAIVRAMMLFRLKTVIAALCLLPLCSSHAAAPTTTVTHYTVSSKGFTIGDVTATQRIFEENGHNQIIFEAKTSVQAAFLWMGYRLHATERSVLQNGTLVSYSRKGRENGHTIDIEGKLEPSSFRFDIQEAGGKRSVVIPRSSYDYTSMECPEARIDFSQKADISLRILDVEKMTVVKRVYHLVRNGNYELSGKEHSCRIVDFSDQNKKARRWTSWNGSTVIMYRQDSTSEKGTYSLQATSMNKEQKPMTH